MSKKGFYQIGVNGREADVYIYGDICQNAWKDFGEVSAHDFAAELKALDVDNINVHIDSYGGEVADGWALYNLLRNHPANITTYADGFVASAAMYPFLAGDRRIANTLSAFYMHEVVSGAYGYAKDLRKAADDADKMTEIGINAFVERTGMDRKSVEKLMSSETWITANDAFEKGIATEIVRETEEGVTQSARGAILQKLFEQKAASEQEEEPKPVENGEQIGADAEEEKPTEEAKNEEETKTDDDEKPMNFIELLAKVFEI